MKRVLVAFALAGCLDSELVECADGRLCPRGTACDVVHHTCVAPDQLVVCEGLADFAECTAVEDGRCFDGVCLAAGCGNGLEEPEENCDDGNVRSGDGCSADCTSEERCGDGFADVGRGEQCDDGNTRGHDGCTNGCTLERLVWREHLSATPTPREYALGAYTPLTREIIIFGGFVGDPMTGMTLSDT